MVLGTTVKGYTTPSELGRTGNISGSSRVVARFI
jgi:hypothetical protein